MCLLIISIEGRGTVSWIGLENSEGDIDEEVDKRLSPGEASSIDALGWRHDDERVEEKSVSSRRF